MTGLIVTCVLAIRLVWDKLYGLRAPVVACVVVAVAIAMFSMLRAHRRTRRAEREIPVLNESQESILEELEQAQLALTAEASQRARLKEQLDTAHEDLAAEQKAARERNEELEEARRETVAKVAEQRMAGERAVNKALEDAQKAKDKADEQAKRRALMSWPPNRCVYLHLTHTCLFREDGKVTLYVTLHIRNVSPLPFAVTRAEIEWIGRADEEVLKKSRGEIEEEYVHDHGEDGIDCGYLRENFKMGRSLNAPISKATLWGPVNVTATVHIRGDWNGGKEFPVSAEFHQLHMAIEGKEPDDIS